VEQDGIPFTEPGSCPCGLKGCNKPFNALMGEVGVIVAMSVKAVSRLSIIKYIRNRFGGEGSSLSDIPHDELVKLNQIVMWDETVADAFEMMSFYRALEDRIAMAPKIHERTPAPFTITDKWGVVHDVAIPASSHLQALEKSFAGEGVQRLRLEQSATLGALIHGNWMAEHGYTNEDLNG